MLIIEAKEGENIDQALKRYKRRFQNAGVIRELRKHREYTKPSICHRYEVLKAVFKEKLKSPAEG